MENTGVDFIGHDKFIENQKKKRNDDQMKFILISSETQMIIDQFNGQIKQSINFDKLNLFELNVWIEVNEGVKVRRTYGDDKMIAFDTEMKAGGKFGWHFHTDCREIIDIQKGVLYNMVDKKTSITGEVITYPRGKEHVPTALKDTSLRVYFDKCDEDCPLVSNLKTNKLC